jgi:hypothetical protein
MKRQRVKRSIKVYMFACTAPSLITQTLSAQQGEKKEKDRDEKKTENF